MIHIDRLKNTVAGFMGDLVDDVMEQAGTEGMDASEITGLRVELMQSCQHLVEAYEQSLSQRGRVMRPDSAELHGTPPLPTQDASKMDAVRRMYGPKLRQALEMFTGDVEDVLMQALTGYILNVIDSAGEEKANRENTEAPKAAGA